MKLEPLTVQKVLDLYYLDSRCGLLELAATLDRLDRGKAAFPSEPDCADDSRYKKLKAALKLLVEDQPEPNRAEQLLNLFS